MIKLLILTDYRDQFWLTTRHKQASFHLTEMATYFEAHGYEVSIKQFSDIDFARENYNSWYVLYQSTEDPYLLYNSFIEDCLLALQEQGAILIPQFKYNRAHHNKVFMELLRSVSNNTQINLIHSRMFGAFNEYERFCHSKDCFFPQIVKSSEGSGSKNVIKINNLHEIGRVKKLMMHRDYLFAIKDTIKRFLPKVYPNFKAQTNARRKIIVQNFIDGLSCDYKVLVFWDKYYVLRRNVRPNDFRASGSGLFEFPQEVSNEFLDFSLKTFKTFNSPFISMDIAQKDNEFYLIEFQFVAFGTYTLEKAQWHFEQIDGRWQLVKSNDILEDELCRSVDAFIHN